MKINDTCSVHTPAIYKSGGVDKLEGIYKLSFLSEAFTNKKHGVAANIEGQFFQIVFWATQHVQFEAGIGPKVLNVEQNSAEMLKPNLVIGGISKPKYGHQFDVVLASDSGSTEPYIGVELKSWSLGPLKKNVNTTQYQPVKRWNSGSGGNAHKQFFLDRVALKHHKDILFDIQWWLQVFEFKDTNKGSPKKAQMDKLVRDKLARLPKPAGDALESLDFLNVKKAVVAGKKVAKKIKLFNIMNVLKNKAKGLLTVEMEGILTEYLQES